MEKLRKTLVVISGCMNILFGLLHASFIKTLDWKNEQVISKMYSIMMQMLNTGLMVFLLSFGVLFIVYRKDLINSRLARAILFIMALFYLVRFSADFVFNTSSIFFSSILMFTVLVNLIPAITYKKEMI
jgi:hypothetical protein